MTDESIQKHEVKSAHRTDHKVENDKNLGSVRSLLSGSLRSLNDAVDESIQQAVRDIEAVLDAAIGQAASDDAESPQRTSQRTGDNINNNIDNNPSGNVVVDDSTIGSDASVDAMAVLSVELEQAQEMFLNLENKDTTTSTSHNTTPKTTNGTKQNKLKEVPLSPDNDCDTKEDGFITARSANILSWSSVVIFIVVLFVIYILTIPGRVSPGIRGSG